MSHRSLVIALALSLGVHAALISWSAWFGARGAKAQSSTVLHAQLVAVPLASYRQNKKIEIPFPISASKKITNRPDERKLQRGIDSTAEPAALPMVLLADSLDEQPQVIVEPNIEPDYGFADDVGGRVVLALLIGTDGSVLWVGTEFSEVDQPTTDYLVRAFEMATFQIPIFRGKPVYAILRAEVTIPLKKTK